MNMPLNAMLIKISRDRRSTYLDYLKLAIFQYLMMSIVLDKLIA
jgi:hypothetical protein